jgi:hypothetical protein
MTRKCKKQKIHLFKASGFQKLEPVVNIPTTLIVFLWLLARQLTKKREFSVGCHQRALDSRYFVGFPSPLQW